MERLLNSQIGEYIDSRFPELADQFAIRSELVEILLRRNIRLQPFEDMGAMIENLGRVHGFLDFEIKCRRAAGVKSPTELMSDEAVDKLIRTKLGYPELVSAPILSEELPSTSQLTEVSFSLELIQDLMKNIKETIVVGLNENLKNIKETISTSLCDDLKSTLLSNFPIMMETAIQSER